MVVCLFDELCNDGINGPGVRRKNRHDSIPKEEERYLFRFFSKLWNGQQLDQ